MTQEKLLEKLRKIKAMADGAKAIGSEAEAEAFADLLQKMLLDHKLEMTDIEFEQMEKEEPVTRRPIRYPEDLKDKRSRVAWRETLTSVVARAHFCRILVHPGSSRCTLVGRPDDIEVAEYMVVTLMSFVRSFSKKEEARYKREVGSERARGFRDSWLNAFINRLSTRYEEERRARTSSPNQSTALVRINRSEIAVQDYMKQFRKVGHVSINNGPYHAEGAARGRAAADAVNLRANAMKDGGRTGPKMITT